MAQPVDENFSTIPDKPQIISIIEKLCLHNINLHKQFQDEQRQIHDAPIMIGAYWITMNNIKLYFKQKYPTIYHLYYDNYYDYCHNDNNNNNDNYDDDDDDDDYYYDDYSWRD